jgi:hypothetical protein
VRLRVGSPEYFELARREPAVADWLAQGPEVQFVLDGKVLAVTAVTE